MQIDPYMSVGPIRPSSPNPFETDAVKKQDETFGDMLKRAIGDTNNRLNEADDKMFKLAMGEVKDIHEVTLAMEKANISLQLTLEIRDRLMEAYQSLMRTAM
jgi:flagellar hook-basal body complex protein FliE